MEIIMSCCGGCGGQEIKKEQPEENTVKQKPDQKPTETEASVGQFDPSKK